MIKNNLPLEFQSLTKFYAVNMGKLYPLFEFKYLSIVIIYSK
ncbi:hypothetical protein M2E15_6093 [Bacillus mycoides]|nr:hypothetical protein M2E15_6093 [Bacillus mycoides]